jgi:enhancing lycopene biosynthesis protein 2
MNQKMKVAVVLCGSGFKDGSEIRESVLTLLSLSQNNIAFQCYAPNEIQADVVNCLTGEASNEQRNMLVEAARIARGEVKTLSTLNPKDFDGLIIPGGFGAAKNLCTFAFKGSGGEVREDLTEIIHGFYQAKKPIGAICIAPTILALALKGKKLSLTVGEAGEAAQEIEKLGHKHTVKKASEALVDQENKIVTTPAYMYDSAELSEIFKGIGELVTEMARLK